MNTEMGVEKNRQAEPPLACWRNDVHQKLVCVCVCDRTDSRNVPPVWERLLLLIGPRDYAMLWSAEIVQHHIISHTTPGQSFIPTPHLNCQVEMNRGVALHPESKSWKHTATTNYQQSHLNLQWNTRKANNATVCHGTSHSLKCSSLPFKITACVTLVTPTSCQVNHCGGDGDKKEERKKRNERTSPTRWCRSHSEIYSTDSQDLFMLCSKANAKVKAKAAQ